MRRHLPDQQGFTLVEVLVVILIIGVLAALALPAFLGQQDRAKDRVATTDVRNAVSQVEACYASTNDYTQCTGANPDVELAEGVVFPDGYQGVHRYAVAKVSASRSGDSFAMGRQTDDGPLTRRCYPTVQGLCRSDLSW